MLTFVYVQSCYTMREVYDRMCELRDMPALLKCDAGHETPEWVCVLSTACKHFDLMQKQLPYGETCNFLITRDTPASLLHAIALFSDHILRCQAYFPGQTLLCKHAIKAWEHLNIICMHCRAYQMQIMQIMTLEQTALMIQKQNEVYARTNHVPDAEPTPPIPKVYPIATAGNASIGAPVIYNTKLEVDDLLKKLQNTAL